MHHRRFSSIWTRVKQLIQQHILIFNTIKIKIDFKSVIKLSSSFFLQFPPNSVISSKKGQWVHNWLIGLEIVRIFTFPLSLSTQHDGSIITFTSMWKELDIYSSIPSQGFVRDAKGLSSLFSMDGRKNRENKQWYHKERISPPKSWEYKCIHFFNSWCQFKIS